jgi:hypothetical protein
MSGSLTTKQKALVRELEELFELLSLDFYDVKSYAKDERTTRLELMRRTAIRAEVVTKYVLVDEYLNGELCDHFFGRKRSYITLWKTKRFQYFNHHFLEELSLMQKLRYVKAFRKIPKGIAVDIERLNALRNGVAHAFFPENLRKSQPIWKGRELFSLEGLKAFALDMETVIEFFVRVRLGRY